MATVKSATQIRQFDVEISEDSSLVTDAIRDALAVIG